MIRKLLLAITLTSTSFFTHGQNTGKSYAITGKENNPFFWGDIKQVDITTGKVVKTLFEANKTPFKSTGEGKLTEGDKNTNPTGLGVAACALDAVHNRLYFAPIHFSTICYLDLNKPEANFTTIKTSVVTKPLNETYQSEENQITRMVIAADGYGYALTNDANHLIRFSTARKTAVEDLGTLIDNPANKEISVHNKCTSWGGDMIADAYGKLIIVAASHNVFTVDIAKRVATLTGTITGLPANFTTNGAAVDNDGYMVVSSANVFDALYKVNMKDLSATKIVSIEMPFNASDLANSNFLLQKEADAANSFLSSKSLVPLTTLGDAKIFPNPVKGSEFRILLEGQKAGRYTIVLTDLAGRTIQSKIVSISKSGQVSTIRLTRYQAKGTYLVNILDEKGKNAFTEKLVIE